MNDGRRTTNVPELEAGVKRGLAGMEQPAKRSRMKGSSSGAAQSSAPGSNMESEATDVTVPQDAHDPPQDDQADGVPAIHPPLPNANEEYAELVLIVKPSVVTVTVAPMEDSSEDTKYRTGFIVSSTNQFAIVFTRISSDEEGEADYSYYVNMEENIQSVMARIIAKDQSKRFCLLIVPTVKKHPSVSFLDTPLTYQRVFTLGAKTGTRLRFGGPVVDTLVGKVGRYNGRVLTPTCSAQTFNYKRVKGSDDYFEVKCLGRDTIVQLKYIDDRSHTAHRLESAPVFALSGQVAGLIDSAGTDVEVKNGFKSIINSIISMCEQKRGGKRGGRRDWQEELLLLGNKMYQHYFVNA